MHPTLSQLMNDDQRLALAPCSNSYRTSQLQQLHRIHQYASVRPISVAVFLPIAAPPAYRLGWRGCRWVLRGAIENVPGSSLALKFVKVVCVVLIELGHNGGRGMPGVLTAVMLGRRPCLSRP